MGKRRRECYLFWVKSWNFYIPFNSGFKLFKHPCKRVFPIIIDEYLYFISEDNSVQRLIYSDEKNGFITNSLDSFSKEVVKDITTREERTQTIITQVLDEVADLGEETTINAKRSLNLGISNPEGIYFEDEDDADYRLESAVSFLKETDRDKNFYRRFLFLSLISPFAKVFEGLKDTEENDVILANERAESIYKNLKSVHGNSKHGFTIDFLPIGYYISLHAGQLSGGDDFVRGNLSVSFLKRRRSDSPKVTYSTEEQSETSGLTNLVTGQTLRASGISREWGSRVMTAGFGVSAPSSRVSGSDTIQRFDADGENLFRRSGGRLSSSDLEVDGNIEIKDDYELQEIVFGWRRIYDEFDDIWDNQIYLIGAVSQAEIAKGNYIAWRLEESSRGDNNKSKEAYPVIRSSGLNVSDLRYFMTTTQNPGVSSVSAGNSFVMALSSIQKQGNIDKGYLTRVATRFKTAVLGEIDNGYLSGNQNGKLNPYASTTSRLCGVDKISDNTLRLYFDKDQINIESLVISQQPKSEDNSGNIRNISQEDILFSGDIGEFDGSEVSREFGGDRKVVHYMDISLEREILEGGGNIKIISYDDQTGSIRGMTNIILEDNDGVYKMRDNLSNPCSGEYDIVTGDVRFYDEENQSLTYPNDEQEMRDWYEENIEEILDKISVLYGESGDVVNLQKVLVKISLGEITETEKKYPVFSSNSRLVYDWIHRTLYFFREGLPFLAYTMDEETGVRGWSRGEMNFDDAVFIDSLSHNPPEHFPTLFGIKDQNILMLSKGILGRKEEYIDNLPNCLDEHIVLEKTSERLNLTDLKNRLKLVGYTDNDRVTIATDLGTIYVNKKLGDLSGIKSGVKGRAYIVGRPYTMTIALWYPKEFLDRRQDVLGDTFTYTSIVRNMIRNSEMYINGNYVKNEKNPRIDSFGYGTRFIKTGVESDRDYDPILEFKSNSPFPFAIGGGIIELAVPNKE